MLDRQSLGSKASCSTSGIGFDRLPAMRSLLGVCLLAVVTAAGAKGEMTVKEYLSKMSSTHKDQVEIAKLYVRGLGDGISWANSAASAPAYCQPEKLVLGLNNYLSIIDREISFLSDRMTKSQIEPMLIGSILVTGLRETFPCPQR